MNISAAHEAALALQTEAVALWLDGQEAEALAVEAAARRLLGLPVGSVLPHSASRRTR